MTLRVALVWCGAIAGIVSRRAYAARPDEVRIVAAVDVDADAARAIADRHGARAFRTLAEALAEVPVDAVDIRLPHHLHREGVLAAIDVRDVRSSRRIICWSSGGCGSISPASPTNSTRNHLGRGPGSCDQTSDEQTVGIIEVAFHPRQGPPSPRASRYL